MSKKIAENTDWIFREEYLDWDNKYYSISRKGKSSEEYTPTNHLMVLSEKELKSLKMVIEAGYLYECQ